MICLVCQSLKAEFFFETRNTHGSRKISEEKFIVLKCPQCGLVFPRFIPGKDFFKKYYPKSYYQQSNFPLRVVERIYQVICLSWLKILIRPFITTASSEYLRLSRLGMKRRSPKATSNAGVRSRPPTKEDFDGELSRTAGGGFIFEKGSVLDFGCGRGDFLVSLSENLEKYGLEINPGAVRFIKKNHPQIKTFRGLAKLTSSSLKFDLITLWHVIEHLEKPRETLKKLSKALKKDGYMIIATPNSESWGFKFFGATWFHLDTPRHLAIFNIRNLSSLGKETGLKLISVRGALVEYPLDLFWSIYNQFKTKVPMLNFLLKLLILPLSLIIKTIYIFLPQKSEVITLIFQKK